MKICVTTTAFPRWTGDGQAVFVWEAVRAIARQGIQVRVVAMHSPNTRVHEFMDGIEIIRPRYWWPERREILRKDGPAGLPITWHKYPLARLQIFAFILAHTLVTTRCARSCDLIHAQWTLSAGAASLGRWIHCRPVLATVQGSDIFQVPQHFIGAWLTRNVLQRCDYVTALSQALKQAVIDLGISSDSVQVIPNGVDTTHFIPPTNTKRDKVILYVGTLIERKGLKYLFTAVPKVLRTFPDYRLVLVGDGPQNASLHQLAKDLGILEQVSFVGFQPPDQIRTWMQRAQALVLPSTEEGMGVVLLEAMACGTPIIGSRVDGIQDVISPDVGLLVPPADSSALTEAIQTLLSDRRKWRDMSHHARVRAVTHYDWDQIATRFVALYKSLLV